VPVPSPEIAATTKELQRSFWSAEACGETPYGVGDTLRDRLEAQAKTRYELEPYLRPFARFEEGQGKDVLEVGVGMGADHLQWALARPRSLTGVDLTERGIGLTRERLALYSLESNLQVAAAEKLPFADASFDLVYSWGVVQHTPDTDRAIQELYRVLRPGGIARVMIYHRRSLVGFMLWGRYALLTGRPWRSLDEIYANYLQGPGTKAYSLEEGRHLFRAFRDVTVRPQLSFGDLLEGAVGQRHDGVILRTAKRVFPRELMRRLFPRAGLYLLLEGRR
jgi:ubiquinone/menaquinone biosynthesis C-methylase UbiE